MNTHQKRSLYCKFNAMIASGILGYATPEIFLTGVLCPIACIKFSNAKVTTKTENINFGSKICDNLQNPLQVKGNKSFPVRFEKRAMLFLSLITFSW